MPEYIASTLYVENYCSLAAFPSIELLEEHEQSFIAASNTTLKLKIGKWICSNMDKYLLSSCSYKIDFAYKLVMFSMKLTPLQSVMKSSILYCFDKLFSNQEQCPSTASPGWHVRLELVKKYSSSIVKSSNLDWILSFIKEHAGSNCEINRDLALRLKEAAETLLQKVESKKVTLHWAKAIIEARLESSDFIVAAEVLYKHANVLITQGNIEWVCKQHDNVAFNQSNSSFANEVMELAQPWFNTDLCKTIKIGEVRL